MKSTLLIGSAVVVLALAFLIFSGKPGALGSIDNPTFGALTNTSSTVGLAAQSILAAASNVQYRSITNVGSFDMSISATTTGLVAGSGLRLRTSSTLELVGPSLYTGALYGIAVGTTTLSIAQF